MEINDFVERLKNAKPTLKDTAFFNIKLKRNEDGTKQIIYSDYTCEHCGTHINRYVQVWFKKPHTLTVFEAGLLYALFVENEKPKDYAGYHNCIAGKEFINNIEKIKTFRGKAKWNFSHLLNISPKPLHTFGSSYER